MKSKIQHKTRKTSKNRKTRKYARKNKTNHRKRGGNPLSRATRRNQTNSRSTLRGKNITHTKNQSSIPVHLRCQLIDGVEKCRNEGRQIMDSRL